MTPTGGVKDLLRDLGSPASVLVVLDFETFYRTGKKKKGAPAPYTLRSMTTESYVRDPRFQVTGVGVKYGNAPSVWMEEWEFRAWAEKVDWSRVALCCHHSHFDGFILAEHYGISPGFWLCTLSIARALHGSGGVGLEKLGPKYGVGEKGHELKDVDGLRREDMSQVVWERLGRYCCNDVDLTAALLPKMAHGFPPLELWGVDFTVRAFTEPTFTVDVSEGSLLRQTLIEERKRKADLLRRLGKDHGVHVPAGATPEEALELTRALVGSDKFADLLRAVGVEPAVKLSAKKTATARKKNPDAALVYTYAFAKSDSFMAELLEHRNPDVVALAEARLAVKSTITETRTERLIGIGTRGPVPFYLKFCGAHTHRWSGGDKMNPQNFNRGGALRRAILAMLGWVIVVADSGQIEARVIAWLAGAADILETFKRNDQIQARYNREFAKRVGALGHEPDKEEKKGIKAALKAVGIPEGDFYSDVGSAFFLKRLSKEETPIERQLAKNMVLGLGFGMGWFKFAGELLKGMLGSDPVQFTMEHVKQFKVDVRAFMLRNGQPDRKKEKQIREMLNRLTYEERVIHCAVAAHFVELYRTTYAKIPALWKKASEMLAIMERPDGDPNKVRATWGPLKIIRHGIIKPNGLVLHYPGLTKKRDKDGTQFSYIGGASGRERKKIYGGLLVENVVQSMARDIVAEQAMRVRAWLGPGQRITRKIWGNKIGTTTHDEVVAVVREEQGQACHDKMIDVMRQSPDWCRTLCLNAEGGFNRSYGLAKA